MAQGTNKTDSTINQTSVYMDTPFVEVTKVFNAPIERVWQAWSDAKLIKQWWGPEGYTSPFVKNDFRVDGRYLFSMKSPEGKTIWTTGIYTEIFPNELIVCTDQFSDEQGHPISPQEAGMEGEWDESEIAIFSIKFEKLDNNKTKIELVHEGIPASIHDECVDGWSTSLDKMKKIVEAH